ncbi:RHS repeat-associated core domain-containing protein [Chromobacterium sp. CV08]|uniref:RHS repeat-associated core domain-containing protein n=1 Tax=Chromobacterium sp. CV08 TaxID=3133274 RepID=UPI003DA9CFA4
MNHGVLGFNGERLDPVSGATHLGNGYRAYRPALMRFPCPDSLSPFGAGGINSYAYCAGDPVNRTDPSGHLSWMAWTSIGLGAAGLALAAVSKGTSIIVSGGLISALQSASAVSIAIGTLAAVSDVAAIACGATEESHPQASAILGWLSLATGAASIGTGLGRAAATRGSVGMAETVSGISAKRWREDGYVALGQDIRNLKTIGSHGIPMEDDTIHFAYLFDDVYKDAARLNIIAHGRNDVSRLSIPLLDHATGQPEAYGPEAFALQIKQRTGIAYEDYRYARLIICRSADSIGGSIFAQHFADFTGLTVKAYSGQVKIARDVLGTIAASAGTSNFFSAAAVDAGAVDARFMRLKPWFGGDKEFFRLHPDRTSRIFTPSPTELFDPPI